MRVDGSLLGAMITHAARLAVLVIDEDDNSPGAGQRAGALDLSNTTGRQQRLIAVAQRFSCPVLLVQFDHSGLLAAGVSRNPPMTATRTALRGLLPHNAPVVTKHEANAFRGTELREYLTQNHAAVNRLVIAGWHANACVAATTGVWDHFAALNPGATNHGYTVMTCDGVLNAGPANWSEKQGQDCRDRIEFYASL